MILQKALVKARAFSIIEFMRKILLALIIPLVLCSCKANEQHEVKLADNGYQITYTLILSEDLVNMVNADNGGDWIGETKKELRKEYGKDAVISEEYDGSDHILKATIFANAKKNSKYSPKQKGEKTVIPLDYNTDSYDADVVDGLQTISSKYTLIVDKEIAPELEQVNLRRKKGDNVSVQFSSKGNSYVVKIPTSWLFTKNPVVEAILVQPKDKATKCKSASIKNGKYAIKGNICQNADTGEKTCKRGDEKINRFILRDKSGDATVSYSTFYDGDPPFICVPRSFKCPDGFFKGKEVSESSTIATCNQYPEHASKQGDYFTCNDGLRRVFYQPPCFEYGSFMVGCKRECEDDEFFVPDSTKSSPLQGHCEKMPEHAHKILTPDESGSFYADFSRNTPITFFHESFECDEGFYRKGDKDVCHPWPKGAVRSEKCWVVEPENLADIDGVPIINGDTIIREVPGDDGMPLQAGLDHAIMQEFMRGEPDSEIQILIPCDDYKKERNLCQGDTVVTLARKKIPLNLEPENSNLGTWSGCWECPEGTTLNAESSACEAN